MKLEVLERYYMKVVCGKSYWLKDLLRWYTNISPSKFDVK